MKSTRWWALISYLDDGIDKYICKEVDIDEIWELSEIIEALPDWNNISNIEIKLLYNYKKGNTIA